MFEYEPDEANRTWPEGIYSASIITVEEKVSKAGNPMLELCIEVYQGTDKKLVWDYIVRPTGIWKLEQIAEAFDAQEQFKAKTFDLKNYLEKSLDVALVTKEDKQYGKQNRIGEYLKYTSQKAAVEQIDDQIPF